MNNNKKICFVILLEKDAQDLLLKTINNINSLNIPLKELVIATKSKKNIKKYDLKDVKVYEYKNENDIYYTLPYTLDYDYITFISAGDIYSTKNNFFQNYNLKNSLYIFPIINESENYALNKKLKKGNWVSIETEPQRFWIQSSSSFISKNLIDLLKNRKKISLKYYISINFITNLILLNGGFNILKEVKLVTEKTLETSKFSLNAEYDYSWYTEIFTFIESNFNYYKEKNNFINKYLKYQTLYLIQMIFLKNTNDKNKHMLKDEKLVEFYDNLNKILMQIDDEIILNNNTNMLLNYYLLKIKYNSLDKKPKYVECYNDIILILENTPILATSECSVDILTMEYIKNKLLITADCTFPIDDEVLNIYALYKGKKYYVTRDYVYNKYKIFGKEIYEKYTFSLEIPLKKSSDKEYIEFFIESKNSNVKLDLKFPKPLAKLTKHKKSYWNCGEFTLNYRNKSILVLQNNKLRHLKREIKYILSMLLSKNSTAIKSGLVRIIYWCTHIFFNKEIWLFEDKIYKAGDNGEYLYTYASKQKDGIKKYYILKKGCLDEKRFKKQHKKYVVYGTLRHKLLFLNSNVVFTTHNNAIKHHSFGNKQEKFFRDLFKNKNVCIQHGLSVQNISALTNRVNDNLKMYFLASPIEYENLKTKEYGYTNNNVLKITGCPRYDGLKNNDKKQILITPTWRSYLALPVLKFGTSRAYNSNFKNSDYYKIYNGIINNKRLIKTAQKYGYKIVYLLHPCTSSQINDFDKNNYVELVAATDDLNYEKILCESSLMVTDYSGVQFDFAYMYKPIIYLHPDELPPTYEEGTYKYSSMALGEIIKKSEELVDLLCEYMSNGCKIKKEYKNRIDKFFKYHDYKNCERIYNEVLKNFYKK